MGTMTTGKPSDSFGSTIDSAEWYDRSINWSARIEREIPVLMDVFGPPASGGLLDAGCGTGRQAYALGERDYKVVGADLNEHMIEVARASGGRGPSNVSFVVTPYATLREHAGGGFDGVYCLGNALAAAGSREGVAQAVDQFARCLRPGGRLFVQTLNYAVMRNEDPCVRGPRLATVDGQQYVSVRHFVFYEDHARVTNVTLWYDGEWHQRSHSGRIYPVSLEEFRDLLDASGLQIDDLWGSYAREPFDPGASIDLIVTATRRH